jgi:site-specific DNA-cytosine methylase
MIYASICDGIGSVHVAWQPIGWRCAWTSEIEPFPIAVVEHHWHLPNLGDMTRITDEQIKDHGPVDLVVGGTPCQSFSVAGLRKGLVDPRGNLAIVFLRLVDTARPRWVVWENVPGVLSNDHGRAFAAFLTAMVACGYGVFYRILDARDYGVPHRRERVIVVGHSSGRWQLPAAVLLTEPSFGWSGAEGESGRPPVCVNSLTTYGQRVGCGETFVLDGRGMRTFTPEEREVLMGFPSGYTQVPTATEQKRIKAVGNSQNVGMMRWIGRRIEMVQSIAKENP